MLNIYKNILSAKRSGKRLLAVLVDPEKIQIETIFHFMKSVHESLITHVFVGGSTDAKHLTEKVVAEIKKTSRLPVVIFPGNACQISDKADGILFLSLISGRNPTYLIDQQVQAALAVRAANLEVIPTGYVLVDGGKKTTVERISETKPICQTDSELILKTALAGEFSGKKMIYLEAGSGATTPVSKAVIRLVKDALKIPLIVGGGIKSKDQLDEAYEAGADLVVIGTAFESDPFFFNEVRKASYERIRSVGIDSTR